MVNGKKKGSRGELEVAKLFKDYGYEDARRSQQYCGVAGDADVIGVPNLHIEVKRRQGSEMRKFIAQAESDCAEGSLPVVCYRDDRKPWVAVMKWEAFEKIYRTSKLMIRIEAKACKNNLFYKWLSDAVRHSPFIDSAVANSQESGKYVFMYLENFIEMYKRSEFGGSNEQRKG